MRELSKGASLAQKWRGEAKRQDMERRRGGGGPKEPLAPRVIWNPPCSMCPDPHPMHVRGLFRSGNAIKLCDICVVFYDREHEPP